MASLAAKRLHQERAQFKKRCPFGFFAKYTLNPDGSQNIMKWHCGIKTSDDSPWAGATVQLHMEFAEDYPGRPPRVVLDKVDNETIFHPNIYPSGAVCLSILNEDKDWRSTLTVVAILNGIRDLLANPNPNSPAQEEAYQCYIKSEDHKEWLAKVRDQVKKIKDGSGYEIRENGEAGVGRK